MARKGLPKSIIKKYGISKKAWRIYRGQKPKKKASRKTKITKRKVRKSARRKKKGRRSRQFTIPVALVGGALAGMVDPINALISGDSYNAMRIAVQHYTGYNVQTMRFDMNELKKGIVPLIIGGLVHKFVGGSPLNVNRKLAAAGVPVLRI